MMTNEARAFAREQAALIEDGKRYRALKRRARAVMVVKPGAESVIHALSGSPGNQFILCQAAALRPDERDAPVDCPHCRSILDADEWFGRRSTASRLTPGMAIAGC